VGLPLFVPSFLLFILLTFHSPSGLAVPYRHNSLDQLFRQLLVYAHAVCPSGKRLVRLRFPFISKYFSLKQKNKLFLLSNHSFL